VEDPGNVVIVEMVQPHIARVVLNRPRVRNAINGAVAQGLQAAADRIEADDEIWVAILASSSDLAFCAGADLAEISAGRADMLSTQRGGFAGFTRLPRKKPWIAAVKGAAFAGGFELCLSCDMIVAAEDARFGLPETKRGLVAAAGGIHRLPRAIPRNLALEMVATGDPIDGKRAASVGLVNRCVPAAEVDAEALRLAEAIARNAPLAVRESLAIARLHAERPDLPLIDMALEATERLSTTADYAEGPRAFLEKREPQWTGS